MLLPTASPTVKQMEEVGFNADLWWAWNLVTVDERIEDRNLKLSVWGDPDDLEVYNLLDDGLTDHVKSMFWKHNGQNQTSPVTGMLNGLLINLPGEEEPFVLMDVGKPQGWARAYRLQCPFWFNEQGFFENSRRLGRYYDEEFYMNVEDYSDGIVHIKLENVHPMCKSGFMEDAAKTAFIHSWSSKLPANEICVSYLQVAADLMLHWPTTEFLTKSKIKVQDILVRAVAEAIL